MNNVLMCMKDKKGIIDSSGKFVYRHLLPITFLIFGVYLSSVWAVNITSSKFNRITESIICFILFYLFIFLVVLNFRQICRDEVKKKFRVITCIVLLVIALFSMSLRHGAFIYMVSEEMRGPVKSTFKCSLIKTIGDRKTISRNNGKSIYNTYEYPTLGFIREGSFSGFYESGSKMSEGTFCNDRLTGTLRFWHENGKEYFNAEFINNYPNGPVHVLNSDGLKVSEGVFSNGKIVGGWTYFSEDKKEGVKGQFDFEKAFNLSGQSDPRYEILSILFLRKMS